MKFGLALFLTISQSVLLFFWHVAFYCAAVWIGFKCTLHLLPKQGEIKRRNCLKYVYVFVLSSLRGFIWPFRQKKMTVAKNFSGPGLRKNSSNNRRMQKAPPINPRTYIILVLVEPMRTFSVRSSKIRDLQHWSVQYVWKINSMDIGPRIVFKLRNKLVQGFRVTCLSTGQYNTKGYDRITDVI